MRRIVFIASGTPTPHADGFGTAILLEICGRTILIDCGPSTTQKLVKTGVHPLELDALFLTHLHFDHCAGVPCLLLTCWDQSSQDRMRLSVFGPPPLAEFVDKLVGRQGAFAPDLTARTRAPISLNTFVNRGGQMKPLYEAGIVTDDHLYAEIGQIAAGKMPGRENRGERIFGLPMGVGAHDVCLAHAVFEAAKESGDGLSVELQTGFGD